MCVFIKQVGENAIVGNQEMRDFGGRVMRPDDFGSVRKGLIPIE